MGITIDKINFGSTGSHWRFNSTNELNFTRILNEYVNKEFDLVRLRVYANTLSEMLIPTSLWQATKDAENGIYSAISASEVRELMCMAYENSKRKGLEYWNLIEPLYLNVAINLNDAHNPRFKPEEEFKYQVNILCSKVILKVNPDVVKDFF
jgi:hypothetical protein